MLDGWRGVSILLVLGAHLLPLGGPLANASVGLVGMVLFFNLSGFLITSFLLKPTATLPEFLIRRFFRIVPLAWLFFAIVFIFQHETLDSWLAHFLFYANLPPPRVRLATDHMWSLCVEVQFYIGIALLFGLLRVRGLLLLPVLGLLFTLLRVHDHVYASSISWYRVDEILAGCTFALAYHGRLGRIGNAVVDFSKAAPQWLLLCLLMISSLFGLEHGAWTSYFRPYLGALLIGATVLNPHTILVRWLKQRVLIYLASISYAVYVIHIGLVHTWLGSGDLLEKYAKRPLLLLVLILLAHLSTFYFEHPMIELGKRLARSVKRNATAPTVAESP